MYTFVGCVTLLGLVLDSIFSSVILLAEEIIYSMLFVVKDRVFELLCVYHLFVLSI